MTAEFVEERRRLADATKWWPEDSPWIRQAIDALPRHLFAPERLWDWDGHAYQPVDRATDTARWTALVYGSPHEAAVTQVTSGLPSSSLSCQGVVVDMLDSLMVDVGDRVLELGAGTGWNAALLGWRTGPGRVTSIEVDEDLATAARKRLATAGVDTTVEVGDGAAGWPQGAPYDRVIATYAVDTLPWAWIEQTRPSGRIIFPWGRLGHVALTVAEDGQSAQGWVQGLGRFMAARGTDTGLGWRQVRGDGPAEREREVSRDVGLLHSDAHLKFALRVQLPDVQITTAGSGDSVTAWLHDGASSWATLSAGGGRVVAWEGGPRRLVDELEQAWERWRDDGAPELWDWGMTIRRHDQFVWCRDPTTGPRWPVATEPVTAA